MAEKKTTAKKKAPAKKVRVVLNPQAYPKTVEHKGEMLQRGVIYEVAPSDPLLKTEVKIREHRRPIVIEVADDYEPVLGIGHQPNRRSTAASNARRSDTGHEPDRRGAGFVTNAGQGLSHKSGRRGDGSSG